MGTVEKQKADLLLQQAFFQQQTTGVGPSAAPQLPQQPQQGLQNAFGVAPGQSTALKLPFAPLLMQLPCHCML